MVSSADPSAEPAGPTFTSLEELLRHPELFPHTDLHKHACYLNTSIPPVFVVDEFLPGAKMLQKRGLREWLAPGPDNHGSFMEYFSGWWASLPSTASGFYDKRFDNYRGHLHYRPKLLKRRFEELVGSQIHAPTWDTAGDNWNGAYHVKLATGKTSDVHTHNALGDVPCGWFGIYYLSTDAHMSSGTWIWRDRRSGLAIMPRGRTYYGYNGTASETPTTGADYEPLLAVPLKFNRLLVARSDILHSGTPGFGTEDAFEEPRLWIGYFFNVRSHSKEQWDDPELMQREDHTGSLTRRSALFLQMAVGISIVGILCLLGKAKTVRQHLRTDRRLIRRIRSR